jgi:hypothetical protein
MPLQVIMRMGKWLHQAMYTHYLAFFKTEGLLAMGEWPHAQQKDFGHFWHERFEINVPDWLIHRVSGVLCSLPYRHCGAAADDDECTVLPGAQHISVS